MPKLYLEMDEQSWRWVVVVRCSTFSSAKWKQRYLLIKKNYLFFTVFCTELTLLTNCLGASDSRYAFWLWAKILLPLWGSGSCVRFKLEELPITILKRDIHVNNFYLILFLRPFWRAFLPYLSGKIESLTSGSGFF